jgi:DNA-binding winged helix-turn-helix (wHTH) protein
MRVTFEGFLLDEGDARLSREGRVIALPPKALSVLCALVRHAGRLVTKDALLDAVWGHRHVTDSVLKSTISQVRAALGDDVKQPRFVETASRHGYRFVAAVRPFSEATHSTHDATGAMRAIPIVGRDAALHRLDQAWADAKRGQRRTVWVTGEAGIGKTALVDQWMANAAAGQMARGQCIEPFGAGEPYLPLLDALSSLCRADLRFPALLRQFAPTWLLQLPWLHEPGEGAELRSILAGTSQDRMLRELCELLEQAAQERPVLLILEDLHWSDISTVRFVDYLARRRAPAQLLLLGTFRSTEVVATDHPLKHLRHELRVRGLCDEIALDPLSERDVGELLRQYWPGAEDEQLALAVHTHTDGLPVFLVNVIDDLRARTAGTIDTQACLQALALRVPESLGGIIGKQFGRLTAQQQALLRAASVRGQSFSQRCVSAVLSLDDGASLEELSALARSGPWIEETGIERQSDGLLRGNYRFRHALYRQAIYAELGSAERVEAHLRLAQNLSARARAGEPISPAEMALHFEFGQSFEDALKWQADAAANALAHLAPEEAARHAERGLQMLERMPSPADFAGLELSLHVTRGVASAQLHGVGAAVALADLERGRGLSETLPHGPQHTWLLNGLGWIYFSRGDFPQAAAQGLAMQRRAEQEADPLLALCAANLMGATRAFSGHLDEAQDWLDRALALLPGTKSDVASVRSIVDLETSIHVYRAQVLAHRGFQHAAMVEVQAALARARQLGQPMSLCLALRCCCLLAIRNDDLGAALAASSELREIAIGKGMTQSIGPAHWYHGWAQARSGQHHAGLREVQEGLEGHRRLGMATGCALAYSYAGQICLWQGNAIAARRFLDEGLAVAQALGETVDQPQLHRLLALVETMEGHAESARAAEIRALACAAGIGAL